MCATDNPSPTKPQAGIEGIDQIDSATKRSRGDVIRQSASCSNGITSQVLAERHQSETRVLIANDVLSEDLYLQDATRLINDGLHWNPVRLMQGIGRMDRRMSPEIEKQLVNDHPAVKDIRGTVEYWNFLPPGELDELLNLYKNVFKKTLLISKTLGIEGKRLLTPGDGFEALNRDCPLGGTSCLRSVWRTICGHFGPCFVTDSRAIGSSPVTKLPRNSPRHTPAS